MLLVGRFVFFYCYFFEQCIHLLLFSPFFVHFLGGFSGVIDFHQPPSCARRCVSAGIKCITLCARLFCFIFICVVTFVCLSVLYSLVFSLCADRDKDHHRFSRCPVGWQRSVPASSSASGRTVCVCVCVWVCAWVCVRLVCATYAPPRPPAPPPRPPAALPRPPRPPPPPEPRPPAAAGSSFFSPPFFLSPPLLPRPPLAADSSFFSPFFFSPLFCVGGWIVY